MVGRINNENTPNAQPQGAPSVSVTVQASKEAVNQYMANTGKELLGAGESPTYSKNAPDPSHVIQVIQPRLKNSQA